MEAAPRRFPVLKSRIGDDGLLELQEMLTEQRRQTRKDVLDAGTDRFERRLSEELGAFRVEVTRESALVRVEVAHEIALVRVDVATSHASLLRWMFALWVSAILAIILK
jgi:hypothetical protein